jgi:hypothetical protein
MKYLGECIQVVVVGLVCGGSGYMLRALVWPDAGDIGAIAGGAFFGTALLGIFIIIGWAVQRGRTRIKQTASTADGTLVPCWTKEEEEEFNREYNLMRCPFCGDEARIKGVPSEGRSTFFIQCRSYPRCAARSFGAGDIKRAVAQWQRRTLRLTYSEDDGYWLLAHSGEKHAGIRLEPVGKAEILNVVLDELAEVLG